MDQAADWTLGIVPQDWAAAVEQARADVAAGNVTEWSVIRARLVAELDDVDAAHARQKA